MAKNSLFTGHMEEAPIKGDSLQPTNDHRYNGDAGYQKRTTGGAKQQKEVNRNLGDRLQKPTRG